MWGPFMNLPASILAQLVRSPGLFSFSLWFFKEDVKSFEPSLSIKEADPLHFSQFVLKSRISDFGWHFFLPDFKGTFPCKLRACILETWGPGTGGVLMNDDAPKLKIKQEIQILYAELFLLCDVTKDDLQSQQSIFLFLFPLTGELTFFHMLLPAASDNQCRTNYVGNLDNPLAQIQIQNPY